MHRIVSLAVLLAAVALLLCAAVPALAESPQDKADCVVEPFIGGPNNPHTHATPASVRIPDNNPAIRWNSADIVPGKVFFPAGAPD